MKLSRFFIFIMTIAVISLFYVHQQIELVKFSYKVQSNQHELNNLLDQNAILKYNVIALKAPYNLENRLAANDIKMVMPERWQVVRVAGSGMEKKVFSESKTPPLLYSFLKFFTLSREAQAKPID